MPHLPCTQTQYRLSVQFYTKCFLLQEICKSVVGLPLMKYSFWNKELQSI